MAATKTKRKATKAKDESTEILLVVDKVECRIDMQTLTYGELAELEDFFGKPNSEITLHDMSGAKGDLILGYLARRRVDPLFTLDHARDLKPGDIEVKEERPTQTPDSDGSPS